MPCLGELAGKTSFREIIVLIAVEEVKVISCMGEDLKLSALKHRILSLQKLIAISEKPLTRHIDVS